MRCRSCGADLPVDSAFCSQCGARVELGSVLGVGTDLPTAPTAPTAATEAAREQQPEPEPGPQAEPDLGQTRELPRLRHPAHPAAAAAAAAPMGEPEPGPAHSRNSIVAMIATFAVLTIIGTFALTRLVGSGDPEPAAQSPSSSVVEESGDAPAASSGPSGSPTPEGSPSASASASPAVPAGARRCSTSGSDSVATAYAGTERTSCEFAAAVRDAYRKAGSPEGATSLRAYSPVTKKWYSLSCDGGEPVRCTSTTNAIVLLAP